MNQSARTRKRRINDEAVRSFAEFGILAGLISPVNGLEALRSLGFGCNAARFQNAWIEARTLLMGGEPGVDGEHRTALAEVVVRLTGEDDIVLKP